MLVVKFISNWNAEPEEGNNFVPPVVLPKGVVILVALASGAPKLSSVLSPVPLHSVSES